MRGSIQIIYPELGSAAGLATSSGMPGALPASVLVIESSPTRQHVLRRVLAGRFPQIIPRRTPVAALELLNQTQGAARPSAILLALDLASPPHTDELLALLCQPEFSDLAVVLLAHNAEPAFVGWASQRARSAILLWEDFTDSADCLARLLAPALVEAETSVPENEPIRVLFVDDSRTVRAAYARLLAEQGYAVEVAVHAEEAMAMAQSRTFDIAIIDYFMPGENGDVLCRRLRADPRTAGLTIAILTGTYLDAVIQDSLKAGAVECMFKNEAQELFVARLAAMSRAVRSRKSVEGERSRLAGILASVGDGVYGVNRAGQITFVNPAVRRILGYPEHALFIGQSAHRLFHYADEDGRANPDDACLLQKAYAGGDELRSWETVFWTHGGTAVPVECTVYPLRIDGQLEGSVVAFRDVSERRALQQELLWQANHDPLTRLHNRRYFELHLEAEVARCRRGGTSALLYLDLDRFKYINDIAGHAAGDQLLVEISQQMRTRLRDTDLLARLGGDEFAIILRNVAEDNVLHTAESFREILERYTFVHGGSQYRIYGSIGVALIGADTQSSGEALANADIACHVAKNKGRNQTHVYEPGGDAKLVMNVDLGWSARLQEALKSDRFVLRYQPIVPLRGLNPASLADEGDLCAAGEWMEDGVLHGEALVRLADDAGEIQPNAFLPTAERFGLMPQIDLWVIRHVIAQLAELQCLGTRACISVNLSGHTLDDERLVPEVMDLLARHKVDPRSIIFEITETNAIANIEAAQRLIGELREHGCRFALDDFGSGFSSFHHLRHLPVDFVKIDGQFVLGMVQNPDDRAIVMSINDIAHSLGKRTVAEFVENREILELLIECGVDYAQGNYISPPLTNVLPAPGLGMQGQRG
ncbi:MAG TPA: EAL domain-containing protein [Acidiferrobacterales bacterium]|nr:EAL domain-containing protein [Acidiferrobacterales bacterium]